MFVTNLKKKSLHINTRYTKDEEKAVIPTMQILRYMGNKRGLLFWLIPQLKSYIKPGDMILDLFAGTSSVGYALKSEMKIIANDIQSYSSEISHALLNFNGKILHEEFEIYLEQSYQKNLNYLLSIYKDALSKEYLFIHSDTLSKYFNLCSTIPSYGKNIKNDVYKIGKYTTEKYISKKRKRPNSFPYNLFTNYYAGSFFSLRQCIEIDSIRYSIDQISDRVKKSVYLSSLIYAISKTVNSTGHFAEYFKPNSINAQKLIVKHRNISVKNHFLSKLSKFNEIYKQTNWKNMVFNYDYRKLISHLDTLGYTNKIKLIYIDPPYTTAQYSRFYHIPETLVKYDYPKISSSPLTKTPTEGKYRDDRHQSPFSQITHAKEAFIEMFGLLANSSDATLAISYSDNSLIQPVDSLIDLAGKYYLVTNVSNGYIHSAQGSRFRQNDKGNKQIHEHLLICKPKYG